MKKLTMTLMAVVFAITANAQYNTNYYDQYGGNIGSSTTRSNYGGGYTTNYYDQYGGSTGSATTRSNYGGGTTTKVWWQYWFCHDTVKLWWWNDHKLLRPIRG